MLRFVHLFFLSLMINTLVSSASNHWSYIVLPGKTQNPPDLSQDWQVVSSLSEIKIGAGSFQGQTVWVRGRLLFPNTMGPTKVESSRFLHFSVSNVADRVFLDGNLVGDSGGGPTSNRLVRTSSRNYFVPLEYLDGNYHEIIIGAYKPYGYDNSVFNEDIQFLSAAPAKVAVGREYFLKLDVPFICALVLVWLGVYYGILFRYHYKLKIYFYLALSNLFVAAFMIVDSWKLLEFGLTGSAELKLSFTLGAWVVYFLQRFFSNLLRYEETFLDKFSLLSAVFFTLYINLQSASSHHIYWVLNAWLVSIVIYLAYFGVRLIRSTWPVYKVDDVLTLFSYVFVVFSISYDVVTFFKIGNTSAVSPYFFLVFSIGIGFRLARDFGTALKDKNLQPELRKKNSALEEVYQQDALTKVLSRRYLEDYLKMDLKNAVGSTGVLSVAVLDIDHFKQYNDSYGHIMGDRLLSSLGWILNGWKNKNDLVFRSGGEEFFVLMKDRDRDLALNHCERLRTQVENFPFDHLQKSGSHVTVSIGVSTIRSESETLHDLYKAADTALYEAKKTRNCCKWTTTENLQS